MLPDCFVSYSWDSPAHKAWVRMFATTLRANGVAVHLDQWEAHLGMDLPAYMERSIRESTYTLLICTPIYARKADTGEGGVGYEKMIVTGEIFAQTGDKGKFVPVLRQGAPRESLPSFLKGTIYADMRHDEHFTDQLEVLLRHLHRAPAHSPPPIGTPPTFTRGPSEFQTRETLDLARHMPRIQGVPTFDDNDDDL